MFFANLLQLFLRSEQVQDKPMQKEGSLPASDQEQEESLDAGCLADADSLFYDLKGFQIHHKICSDGEESDEQMLRLRSPAGNRAGVGLPMILLHGFGASVFSWGQVMEPLSRLAASKVLAFDRPAFGLTSREFGHKSSSMPCLNPYSTAFSVLATMSFLDLLGTDKVILIGHSAGCLVAANACLEAPDRIAALILVAPAIPAPFTLSNLLQDSNTKEGSWIEHASCFDDPKNPDDGILRSILTLFMIFSQSITKFLEAAKGVMIPTYKRALSAILRSSLAVIVMRIFMTKLGVPILKSAWYDAKKVTLQIIEGYTKALKTKNWEMALLEYILAILLDLIPESKPPLNRRLCEIACPVLIITGDTDRLVPSWNAKRLAAAIPGSTLEVIKDCGHLPHEEKVDEFMMVVKKFLQEELVTDDLREEPNFGI